MNLVHRITMPTRSLSTRIGRRVSRIVKPRRADVVDLGSGGVHGDVSRYARKKKRKIHAIDAISPRDFVFKAQGGRKSKIKLFSGQMQDEVKSYRSNSVKLFQLKVVFSGCLWKGEALRKEFTPMFREIFRALKSRGRFRILDKIDVLEDAKPALEEVGFEVEIRKAEPGEIRGLVQERYLADSREDPSFYPHILTAVKRKSRKRD